MSRIGITAAYPGWCGECDQPIAVGDHILRGSGTSNYVHVTCPDEVGAVERTPCPRCFQVPAVSGKCSCYEAGEIDGAWAIGLMVALVILLVLVAFAMTHPAVH